MVVILILAVVEVIQLTARYCESKQCESKMVAALIFVVVEVIKLTARYRESKHCQSKQCDSHLRNLVPTVVMAVVMAVVVAVHLHPSQNRNPSHLEDLSLR